MVCSFFPIVFLNNLETFLEEIDSPLVIQGSLMICLGFSVIFFIGAVSSRIMFNLLIKL